MKKSLMMLFFTALLIAVPACSSSPAEPVSSTSTSSASAPGSSEAASSSVSEPISSDDSVSDILPMPSQQRTTVADASLFRGTIEDFAVSDDGKTVLLMNRAIGSGYSQDLKVKLTDSTNFDFDSTKMGNGTFLEVYYGDTVTNPDGSVDAIQINYLGTEDMVNYNGTVKEISLDPDESGSGYLLLEPIDNGMEYQFNFDSSTQFYMELGTIQQGDQLNILHSPVSTRSLPPQSFAWEVSKYTAPTQEPSDLSVEEDSTSSAPDTTAVIPEKVTPNTL